MSTPNHAVVHCFDGATNCHVHKVQCFLHGVRSVKLKLHVSNGSDAKPFAKWSISTVPAIIQVKIISCITSTTATITGTQSPQLITPSRIAKRSKIP
eukprot:3783380-Amphidinium_carterae.1